ncbi:MAG: hypothetical protein GQ567_04190 [Methanosarcinales archaeon]|nr:hypothetical protein [Methanosarcinales archaeon]
MVIIGAVGIAIDAALYYEMHDVVDGTINIIFIEACEARKLVSGAGVGAEGFWGSGNRGG